MRRMKGLPNKRQTIMQANNKWAFIYTDAAGNVFAKEGYTAGQVNTRTRNNRQ